MQIRNGYADGVERLPSPNFNNGHESRELIVLHYTAGYTLSSATTTFRAPAAKASAHFVIGTDGRIVQMVDGNHTAWHAGYGVFRGGGRVNQRSIGIELVNPGYHFRTAAGQLLNWERKPIGEALLAPFPGLLEAGDPWIGSATAFWPLFPEAQLAATEQLIRAILDAWPAIFAIVGHRDVDSVRRLKVDPGPAFPLARMQRLIGDRADPADLGGQTMIVHVGTTLNVRGGPGTEYEKLRRGPLRDGQRVQALEVRGDWMLVRVGDGDNAFEGWCHGAYLRPAP